MRFEMLQWVFLLWAIPIFGAFLLWRYFAFKKSAEALAAPSLLKRIAPLHSSKRLLWRYVMALVTFVFCVFAILRPQWGYRWEDVERRGVDIVVAIDLSDSMMAEDVSPNRLERARRKVSDLLRILEGDRVGLVAFAGKAIIQSPLTMDYGAIDLFLRSLDTDSVPVKGTSLGQAIQQAAKVFEMAESSSRALLLITDGEELDKLALPAAEEAKKQGIRIYSIGIGTEKGAPVPNREGGGFRKKPDGEIVFSKLNEEGLTQLASVTGGAFVRSVSDDSDLVRIYRDDIRKDVEAKNVKSTRMKRFEERFQWPVGAALVFLMGEIFLWTFWRRKRISGVAQVIFLACAGLIASQEKAQAFPFTTQRFNGEKKYGEQKFPEAAKSFEGATVADPADAEARFNLGAAYYKQGEFAKAEDAWKSALQGAADSKIKQETLYNLGNAAYRQGRLEDAVTSYRAAKEMDPSDREAAHNLELALAELKKRKEQQQQRQQKTSEQKEQEKREEKKKQEQKQKAQQQEQQQKQQDGDKMQEEQKPSPQEQQRKLSKEEAERLLDALNDEKKKAKEQMRMPRDAPESPYDW